MFSIIPEPNVRCRLLKKLILYDRKRLDSPDSNAPQPSIPTCLRDSCVQKISCRKWTLTSETQTVYIIQKMLEGVLDVPSTNTVPTNNKSVKIANLADSIQPDQTPMNRQELRPYSDRASYSEINRCRRKIGSLMYAAVTPYCYT
jgi:hypothetical protein